MNIDTLKEHLLLQEVKRYAICHTNREQSVAEHSYNVLLIAVWLTEESDKELRAEVMWHAAYHDMDEIETGDIPSPFKRMLRVKCPAVIALLDGEHEIKPEVKAIVKLADCLEAIYYLQHFGGSRYAMEQILPDVRTNFHHIANTSVVPDSIRLRALDLEKAL